MLRWLRTSGLFYRRRSDAARRRQVIYSLVDNRMDTCDVLFGVHDGDLLMHGPNKKPSRGVCQVCGRPVVAFEYEEKGCIRPGPTIVNGHIYDRHDRLTKVRCHNHWNGILQNSRELDRPPTNEDLELASKIRGSKVTYKAPPERDPNVLVLPLIAKVFPTLLAQDIASVQPMTAPLTMEVISSRTKP